MANELSEKAIEDRRLILEALEQRFKWRRLSERKNPDGTTLSYQDFITRMESKEKEAIPVRIITPNNSSK